MLVSGPYSLQVCASRLFVQSGEYSRHGAEKINREPGATKGS